MQLQSVLLLSAVLLASSSALQHVYYVKPLGPVTQQCPGQPCLTLGQYVEKSGVYFTTGATFVLLAGNHDLEKAVTFFNVSDVTFKAMDSDSDVTILCKYEFAIICSSCSKITIEGITFVLHSQLDSSAVKITASRQVLIELAVFVGTGGQSSHLSRGIIADNSDVTIVSCHFEGNTADNGGAVYASGGAKITLDGNKFVGNQALLAGGAVYAHECSIVMEERLGNVFANNSATFGGALSLKDSSYILETSNSSIIEDIGSSRGQDKNQHITYFASNYADAGGALYLDNSNATLHGTAITFESNMASLHGGAVYSTGSSVTSKSKYSIFVNNTACLSGGAITSKDNSVLTVGESSEHYHFFGENMCVSPNGSAGGAIFSLYGHLRIAGNGSFRGNLAIFYGGAVSLFQSDFVASGTLSFVLNSAKYGGAILLNYADTTIRGATIEFLYNSAEGTGGGITCSSSVLLTENSTFYFLENMAEHFGGGIYCMDTNQLHFTSATFINNTSEQGGGAISIQNVRNASLHDITVSGSMNSALFFTQTTVVISGTTILTNNMGVIGGAILLTSNSFITITGNTLLENNKALGGGAVMALSSSISFTGTTLVSFNEAEKEGGGYKIANSAITLSGMINFTSNTAVFGGAIHFDSKSTLTLKPHTTLTTSQNYAHLYGGALYHTDNPTEYQCNYNGGKPIVFVASCFIKLEGLTTTDTPYSMISQLDSAGGDGGFIFGGLLDRCRMEIMLNATSVLNDIVPFELLENKIFHITPAESHSPPVTSKPYQLCFCESDSEYNCSRVDQQVLYRGQTFQVSLLAHSQGYNSTSTTVTAIVNSTARIKLTQSMQPITSGCVPLTYNIYSTGLIETMTLYPEGPCRDTGLVATAVVNVTFKPCPNGFIQHVEKCVCEERLQIYDADCVIDDTVYIRRNTGSKFWMNPLFTMNGTYVGLASYKTCPADYCKHQAVNITLDNPDIQCDFNRSGVLCGACAANHSLVFGSSQCQRCSNVYLALLVPFAAAGVVLVIFLTVLRLTVATGMVNSLILYANIVQANKNLLIPTDATNVLTVFIAWMNLDLGFQTCFYDGMGAYIQTWLQFAFPLYIWILISLIILSSRYSIAVSKLIGSNPIAVLASLLLMSYAKILRIVIEVYSSVDLEYPDNKTVTVWLKDANVPYLQSKHLALTVITSLVLFCLFLPYTLLLLLGHFLYRFTGRKYFRWFTRIRPLLDAYYAPYKKHTRYWTGFLLLLRCALYVVFSLSSLGATNHSLLAITITFTMLLLLAWISILIYTSFLANIIEASVYFNLIILSAATQAGANSPTLAYTMVGIAFATLIGITLRQFHIVYISRTASWKKISESVVDKVSKCKNLPPPLRNIPNMVTTSYVDMRESLLDSQ